MTTGNLADGRDLRPPEAPAAEPRAPGSAPPPVLAVVVTHAQGAWLERTLDSLADQDYPRLTVLVVDVGSDVDSAPRVTAVRPEATGRRVPGTPWHRGGR